MVGTTNQQLPLLLTGGLSPVLFTFKYFIMPAFFVKNTTAGIVVSNKKLVSKEVTLKNGQKRMISNQVSDIKFGFFGCKNPQELGYEPGETIPVSLSNVQVLPDSNTLFWCNPD
jgi:uncharacterized protein YodC (DUF2158 family)